MDNLQTPGTTTWVESFIAQLCGWLTRAAHLTPAPAAAAHRTPTTGCCARCVRCAGIFLLGYGLVAVPKQLWKCADLHGERRRLEHQAGLQAERAQEAHRCAGVCVGG